MKKIYITGTSRGIGHALALEAIQNGYKVYGIGRKHTIEDNMYHSIDLDLADMDSVKKFEFKNFQNGDEFILVNNAGTLGQMAYVGDLDSEALANALHINLLSPMLLCNAFIKALGKNKNKSLILNLSSGAGKNPYDGWSAYCTTKAGLDMWAQVLDKEQNMESGKVKVINLSPGIVETHMQAEIRDSKPSVFSMHDKFIDIYNQKLFKTPKKAAKQIMEVIMDASAYPLMIDLIKQ